MPPSEFRMPEIPEPGHGAGPGHAVHAEAQLTNRADVSQAHQFFQAKADAGLPTLNLQGDGGASVAAHKAVLGGSEQVMSHAMSSVGHAAMAGSQQISPMIQMIMKLPGLTGVMNSLFEFLGALFNGNILDALNPADWLQHAGEAVASLADGAQHLASSIDILPANGSMLHFDGQMFHPATQAMGGMRLHSELLDGHAAFDPSNVGAPVSDVDLSQAVFEKTSNYTISEYHQQSLLDWHQPRQVALGGDMYKPTMGGYYQSTSATPPSTGASAQVPAQHPAPHTTPHHTAHHQPPHHAKTFHPRDITAQPDRTVIAQTTDATAGQYTIQHGDSLWEIARKQLGDGSRWGEIYKLNASSIGQNPDLIQPGTVLQMPDHTSIASAGGSDYVVHSGDNLWKIAEHRLGGGTHWGEIYQTNTGVIGSNPGLIHPGQHLNLGGDTNAIASAPTTDASAVAASNPVQAQMNVASTPTASAPSASEVAAAQGDLGAPNGAFSSQPTAGMLKAETPMLAPVNSTPAASAMAAPQGSQFARTVGATGEEVIDSSTRVPPLGG